MLVPISLVRPFADQPRNYFCNVRLTELANSIKEIGQTTPVEVRRLTQPDNDGHEYELIDGQRRWHACQMAGLDRIRLTVTQVANQEEQFVRSIVANFGRAGHTPMEICAALCRLEKNGMSQAAMANALGRNAAWVSSHLSLARLVPAVQEMLHPEHPQRLGLRVGVMLASLPPDLQLVLAKKISSHGDNGMTEAAARMAIRSAAGTNSVPTRTKGRPMESVWRALTSLTKRTVSLYDLYVGLSDRDYRVTLAKQNVNDVARHLQSLKGLAASLLDLVKRIERQFSDRAALTAAMKQCHGGHDDETKKCVGSPGVVVSVDSSSVGGDSRVGVGNE